MFITLEPYDDALVIPFSLIVFIFVFLLYKFLQSFGKIKTDRFGISLSYPLREEIQIAWIEIDKISNDWTDQRVKVINKSGDRKIPFSTDLPGFNEINDDIYSNRPDLFLPLTGQSFTIGLRRIFQYLIILTIYGIVAFVIIDSGKTVSIGGLLTLVGSIIGTYIFMRFLGMLTLKITFDNNEIQATTLFRRVVIPREGIRNVFLNTSWSRYPIMLSTTLHYHLDGSDSEKSLTISGLSCGSPYLYGAIQSWIDSGK